MNVGSFASRGFWSAAVLIAVLGGMLVSMRAARAQYPARVTQYRVIYNTNPTLVGTGVFVNGRQLTHYEAAQVRQIYGYVLPGNYWMRRDGTFGLVGGPPIGNIYLAAQAVQNRGFAPGQQRINHHSRPTLVVPGAGVLLPDGTSMTW